MSSVSNEILWQYCLLRELDIPIHGATPLNADNTSAMQLQLIEAP